MARQKDPMQGDEREGLRPYLTRLKKELWYRVWKRESCYAEMERHEEYFSIVPEVSLTTRTWTSSLSKSDLKLFHRLRLFYIPVRSVLNRWRQSSSTTCQYCLLALTVRIEVVREGYAVSLIVMLMLSFMETILLTSRTS